jgi:RNA polymerase sigma factor (TIGR02999 family)
MSDDIQHHLHRVNANEPGAMDALFASAYSELRKLARARLYGMGRSDSMNTVTLVHESYLRLVHGGGLRGQHRGVFFSYASQIMRSVIVDAARSRNCEFRGGGSEPVPLDTYIADSVAAQADEPAWVHEALEKLAEQEPRLAKVVEMRYYGGFSEAEIAETLGLNERTVRRDWVKARLLLARMLGH